MNSNDSFLGKICDVKVYSKTSGLFQWILLLFVVLPEFTCEKCIISRILLFVSYISHVSASQSMLFINGKTFAENVKLMHAKCYK